MTVSHRRPDSVPSPVPVRLGPDPPRAPSPAFKQGRPPWKRPSFSFRAGSTSSLSSSVPRTRSASTSPLCVAPRAPSPSTPLTATPAPARAPSPSSTARRGFCATAAIRSRSWPSQATFLEVAYLLIYGELPDASPSSPRFEDQLTRHTLLHEEMKKLFDGFPATAHPMAVLSAMIASLSTYYPQRAAARRSST